MKFPFKIYILYKALEGSLFNEHDWIWAFEIMQLSLSKNEESF